MCNIGCRFVTVNCRNCCFLLFKVQIGYPSQLKTKIIRDDELRGIAKKLAETSDVKAIAGKVYALPTLRSELQKKFLSELKKNVTKLTSRKFKSVLHASNADMLAFNFEDVLKEWQVHAPFFLQVLQTIGNSDQTDCDVALLFLGSCALFHRNNHQSLLQHITGQLLDSGGTTDEVSPHSAYAPPLPQYTTTTTFSHL